MTFTWKCLGEGQEFLPLDVKDWEIYLINRWVSFLHIIASFWYGWFPNLVHSEYFAIINSYVIFFLMISLTRNFLKQVLVFDTMKKLLELKKLVNNPSN